MIYNHDSRPCVDLRRAEQSWDVDITAVVCRIDQARDDFLSPFVFLDFFFALITTSPLAAVCVGRAGDTGSGGGASDMYTLTHQPWPQDVIQHLHLHLFSLTLEVNITSLSLMFIQLSQLSSRPLYVSPFFSSTSIGWPWAVLSNESGSCAENGPGGHGNGILSDITQKYKSRLLQLLLLQL